jgi:hypothetical protein
VAHRFKERHGIEFLVRQRSILPLRRITAA